VECQDIFEYARVLTTLFLFAPSSSLVYFDFQDESIRNPMVYSLAMASQSQKFPPLTPLLDARMKEQLKISRNQLFGTSSNSMNMNTSTTSTSTSTSTHHKGTAPPVDLSLDLPRTLSDALHPTPRAVVITEPTNSFRIVNVNKAWEGLCEYTHVESHGKSLGALIQGPETDQMALTALMAKLLQGETATTILTNYTKSGRKFQNRLSVGPLYDDETGKLSQFVGILQEV
jgi:PAS domain S-box-containing protein